MSSGDLVAMTIKHRPVVLRSRWTMSDTDGSRTPARSRDHAGHGRRADGPSRPQAQPKSPQAASNVANHSERPPLQDVHASLRSAGRTVHAAHRSRSMAGEPEVLRRLL